MNVLHHMNKEEKIRNCTCKGREKVVRERKQLTLNYTHPSFYRIFLERYGAKV